MANGTLSLKSLGRDPQPFGLTLDGFPGEPLYCLKAVRTLPGKRYVCQARWRNQEVFAKLYLGSGRRRHWLRELAGLRALASRNISCPAIVHAGTVDGGQAFVVLLEPIRPAESLHAVWSRISQDERLLDRLMALVADLHSSGLEHCDPHLDNFLLCEQRIYTLDGGEITVHRHALDSKRSLRNLALLLATLPPGEDHFAGQALALYCAHRGWPPERLTRRFRRLMANYRRRHRDRVLGKIFRDCSAFVCRRTRLHYTVFRRSYASPTLECLLANPDASLHHPQARVLKNGNTCTVWSVPVADRTLVIKRYNIKGFLHGLNRAWRRTRGAMSWENAHRLAYYGISTPAPVALVEERLGPLHRRAYFITEAVNGPSCDAFFRNGEPCSAEQRAAVVAVSELLARLADFRISHGDMKASNIILGPAGPMLIDLDALREHRWQRLFRRAQRRDMDRFKANWRDQPELWSLFEKTQEAIDSYPRRLGMQAPVSPNTVQWACRIKRALW